MEDETEKLIVGGCAIVVLFVCVFGLLAMYFLISK